MKCYTLKSSSHISTRFWYTFVNQRRVFLCLFVCSCFCSAQQFSFNCSQNPHNMCDKMRRSTWLTVFSWAAKIESRTAATHDKNNNKTNKIILFVVLFSICQTMANCALKLLKFNRLRESCFWAFLWEVCACVYQKLVFININLNFLHLDVRLKCHRKHTNT